MEVPASNASPARAESNGAQSFPPLGPAIKVLMIWPRFPPSFWSFDGVMEIVPEQTLQAPLGLLTVAALCPRTWQLRLVDRSFADLQDGTCCGPTLLWSAECGSRKMTFATFSFAPEPLVGEP